MRDRTRTLRWLLVYVLLAVAPLLLSLIQLDPGRGFWVNVSVGAGFVGLSLMGLQFVLAARSVRINRPFGADVLLQFHRQITVLIAILIFAHPIILMFWDSRFLALLNIVESPVRAKLAVLSVVLLLVLIATSVWRRKLRLRYQVWQLLHAVLAVLIVVTGLAHVLLIGYYVEPAVGAGSLDRLLGCLPLDRVLGSGAGADPALAPPLARGGRAGATAALPHHHPRAGRPLVLRTGRLPVPAGPVRLDPHRSFAVRSRLSPVLDLLQRRGRRPAGVHHQDRAAVSPRRSTN